MVLTCLYGYTAIILRQYTFKNFFLYSKNELKNKHNKINLTCLFYLFFIQLSSNEKIQCMDE